MKLYKFRCTNGKTGNTFTFWRAFPSAYRATTYSDRITFNHKMPFVVTCEYGEEKEV